MVWIFDVFGKKSSRKASAKDDYYEEGESDNPDTLITPTNPANAVKSDAEPKKGNVLKFEDLKKPKFSDAAAEESPFVPEKIMCRKCRAGNMQIKEGTVIRWLTCENCGHRILERRKEFGKVKVSVI